MRQIIPSLLSAAVVVAFSASTVFASSIPNLDFPVKNGAHRDDVYKMSEHKNSVFVFEAFADFCGGCHENAPNVDEFAIEFAANPRVQVLDLGLDRVDSAYQAWIDRHHPNHLVIQDTDRKVFNALRTDNFIPQVFIVDCHGVMVGNHIGVWDEAVKTKLRGFIATALATTCD
jgi:Redoxin